MNPSACDFKVVNGEMGGVAILKLQSRRPLCGSLDLGVLLSSAGSLQISIVNQCESW